MTEQVRRLVLESLNSPYISNEKLCTSAKQLLGDFIKSVKNIPYVVRFSCKLILSRKRRERPDRLGVYPCEKLVHKLLFHERLARSVLSEVLPIKDVHKKFVADYILASTDPKMKNPEVLEFIRILIGVGHPSPCCEDGDDDDDEKEENEMESFPPGLSIPHNQVSEMNKEKVVDEKVSSPIRSQEIRSMRRVVKNNDDMMTTVRALKSELSVAQDEVQRYENLNRDGWCRVFARSLSEELHKDFVSSSSRNKANMWSATSRQRLFGGTVNEVDEDEEDEDSMTEGVTSMLSSFRSVSPLRRRSPKKSILSTTTSPPSLMRRSRGGILPSKLLLGEGSGENNVTTGLRGMEKIGSILDRLNELSREREMLVMRRRR